MPSVKGSFSSGTSFAAADLDKPVVGTIREVELRQFDDGNKLIVRFEEHDKVLICNKTNANRIADGYDDGSGWVVGYGDDTDGWIGKKIQLYRSKTEFKGQTVDCVRVKVAKMKPQPRPKPAPPPVDDGFGDDRGQEPEDDLPF